MSWYLLIRILSIGIDTNWRKRFSWLRQFFYKIVLIENVSLYPNYKILFSLSQNQKFHVTPKRGKDIRYNTTFLRDIFSRWRKCIEQNAMLIQFSIYIFVYAARSPCCYDVYIYKQLANAWTARCSRTLNNTEISKIEILSYVSTVSYIKEIPILLKAQTDIT